MNKVKRLGQHFLKNRKILEEMARAAGLAKKPASNATHSVAGGDVVLEVGPGTGTLTEVLAERAKRVIAVEKDRDLIPVLREKFRNKKNVEIIDGDILAAVPPFGGAAAKSYKIVANIPYYITSRFLRLFLTHPPTATQLLAGRPRMMVLMIQREVAERICAKPPHMNLLALSVQAYAKPEIVRIVPRGAFSPPPKVDSAIIRLEVRSERLEMRKKKQPDLEKILSIARLAFQQKRKMLRHSIGKKIDLPEKFKKRRPEELTLKQWLMIC